MTLREFGQINRKSAGLVDLSKPITFAFNGKVLSGFDGDTLASALLANDIKLVGRSFKYHRPRGIFSAGPEEPNALMAIGKGAHKEPNTRATTVELFDGLEAFSQNHMGSLNFDLLALNDLAAPFLSAGFYYKTFMWPAALWEKFYEPVIRRAAGLGSLSGESDPAQYDKGFLHADLLIVGAGPAGLAAALQAGRSGIQVVLVDQDFRLGGRLLSETHTIDTQSGSDWAEQAQSELQAMDNVRVMTRTTAYGAFDHGIYGLLESKTDHMAEDKNKPRQVLWRLYSKRALICAGALERSIAFGNNDRPGIMLAGSLRTFINRFGVAPGQRLGIFANNDQAINGTKSDAERMGFDVQIFDTRRDQLIKDTKGRGGITRVLTSDGKRVELDLLAVSGGWNPNVHLTSHQRGRPVWNDEISAFVPGDGLPRGQHVAGAANGIYGLADCLKDGANAAQEIAQDLGAKNSSPITFVAENESQNVSAFWQVDHLKSRSWIDLQNDVTSKDIRIAKDEGFVAVEHLKRYTTLGMATDQGKTSNVLGLAVMAELTGKSIPETGTTIFRPPVTPVAIGALGGRSTGKHFKPTRLTPSHKWAEEQGAVFVETGMWLRAQWYPKPGETHWRQTVDREVAQTRSSVGICDVTTLGKIDVQGQDAATFLNKVYANGFAKLAVGKVRYGLMLREDGIVMDDGTTARMSETHFVMTTTTANAVNVFRHLEFCRQCLWPDLDVQLISATEQWAQFAVAGPKSRALLSKVVDPEFDISNDGFPFMACGEVSVCGGTHARLFRISFSGELAYELAVPAQYGDALIRVLMETGEEFDAVPYGTEALGVMRIEKGHPAGNELNGQTTALNMGLGGMVSSKKDSVGSALAKRPAMNSESAMRLVGLKPVQAGQTLTAGAHFLARGAEAIAANDEGYMTSVAYSPTLNSSIGLGYLERGNQRMGETLRAVDLVRGKDLEVEVVSAHFVDPAGDRLRG